jgi:hypothetical protein
VPGDATLANRQHRTSYPITRQWSAIADAAAAAAVLSELPALRALELGHGVVRVCGLHLDVGVREDSTTLLTFAFAKQSRKIGCV